MPNGVMVCGKSYPKPHHEDSSREIQWPAIRKLPLLHSIDLDLALGAALRGDFVNAASDPRGFVKSELSRPSGVLLEVPGLL